VEGEETGEARQHKDATQKSEDDSQRKQFVILLSQLEEPARSQLQAHHQKAVSARIETRFIQLLLKAVEGCSPRERREYFMYVAMLNWDRPYRDFDRSWHQSVLQELTDLARTPNPEILRRHEQGRHKGEKWLAKWAEQGAARRTWRKRVKRWIGYMP
jgi:hypothetical protein